MSKGEPGSGAGQGGGTGGTIRDAGGSFGKREAAMEDQYFKKLVSTGDVTMGKDKPRKCFVAEEKIMNGA
ncbi:hypothetical protein E2C01_072811 [Portunus trituberculatus]|uniref:Uncharacterized protein n=1 Tax=Portunus trituberculatus TaxID=210409 RepID=A0A5B7I9Y3_PORTR|nr:hypothetical protein [Portunus trituberculatus]